jgi:uncharacterized protein (TIGR00730 family)
MKLESVCVYCGSSPGNDPGYAGAAERLGEALASAGIRLIYGGGSIGLMGVLARAVLRHGGEVNGIIPGFLRDRELALPDVTDLTVTSDMHSRKRQMFDRADAFVALPGGIGTLEEVVEMMTWVQLGHHRKPIILVNHEGFWEPLIRLLDHMAGTGFLRPAADGSALFQTVTDVGEVLPALERAAAELPAGSEAGAPTALF